jgi:putative FmdB family regulatory protein
LVYAQLTIPLHRYRRPFGRLNRTLTPAKIPDLSAGLTVFVPGDDGAHLGARQAVQYSCREITEPRGGIEMALYEYKCAGCEDRFDLMRPMSAADDPAECPECGSTDSRRVISNFASITPGASALSTNPVMDARMARGGGGCCGGGCGCG